MINLNATLLANQRNDQIGPPYQLIKGEAEGRKLTMQLIDADGSQFDLTSASLVSLFFRKSDGKDGQLICTVENASQGIISVVFTSQSGAVAGPYRDCVVKVTWSDSSNSKFAGPKIMVLDSASDDAPISSNEYQILDQLITDQTDATATAVQAAEDATAAAQTATDAKTAAQTAATTAQTAAITATEAQTAAETAKTAAQAASASATASAASAGTDATRAETAATQAVAAATNVDQIVADAAEAVRDDIQIGGRNLLANSNIIETRTKDATDTKMYSLQVVDGYDLDTLINKELTVSVYMDSPGERDWSLVESVGMRNRFGIYVYIMWANDAGGTETTSPDTNLLSQAVDGKRIHATITATPPEGYTHMTKCAVYVCVYARPASTNDATWVLSRPQLEIGNMATDWSPAPEDSAPDALKLGGVDAKNFLNLGPCSNLMVANDDFNSTKFLTVGEYVCQTNAIAETLQNCPIKTTGRLTVRMAINSNAEYDGSETWRYLLQEWATTGARKYTRYLYSTGTPTTYEFSPWVGDDDGNWTPVLMSNTTPVAATYIEQSGVYVRDGKLVHIEFKIRFTGDVSAYNTAIRIEGLPYLSKYDSWGGSCAIASINSANNIDQYMVRVYQNQKALMLARKEIDSINYTNFNNSSDATTTRFIYGSTEYIVG